MFGMTKIELEKAKAEGQEVMMRKYRFYGMWSTPKKVSAEIALHKSKIILDDGWCPYIFTPCEKFI